MITQALLMLAVVATLIAVDGEGAALSDEPFANYIGIPASSAVAAHFAVPASGAFVRAASALAASQTRARVYEAEVVSV